MRAEQILLSFSKVKKLEYSEIIYFRNLQQYRHLIYTTRVETLYAS